MPPGDIAPVFITIAVAICASAVLILRGPLGRAVESWARGKRGGEGGLSGPELDDLRARLAQLEEGQAHMLELEERLDFAERLLARQAPARPSELRGEQH